MLPSAASEVCVKCVSWQECHFCEVALRYAFKDVKANTCLCDVTFCHAENLQRTVALSGMLIEFINQNKEHQQKYVDSKYHGT